MDKDILDQYIYEFPFTPPQHKDSCTLLSSTSFQSYFKDASSMHMYNTIEDALEGFSRLFNRSSVIRPIALFYEKDNDFICKIANKLISYIGENEI